MIALIVHALKEAEEEVKAVERAPIPDLHNGYCEVKLPDLYPSLATADIAYRNRVNAYSQDHPTESWQDQGRRLCSYEDDWEKSDKLEPDKPVAPTDGLKK